MCDFFSAVIRRDGAIFHLPTNSHSGIVDHYKLTENDIMADMRDQPRFYEFEWNCQGDVPSNIASLLRGSNPPQAVTAAANVLAKNLRRAIDAPGWGLLDDGAFADDVFADLRWKALINDKCPHKVANSIAPMSLYAFGDEIKSLHPAVTAIQGSFKIASGYQITAPALTEVAGFVDVSENATFTAPALTEVAGPVYVSENATFTAPALTKAGSVDVSENATFTAPALTKAGYVDVSENATFTAPKSVGGTQKKVSKRKSKKP